MNSKKWLYSLAVLCAAFYIILSTLVLADDQAPPVVKRSSWGQVKVLYRGSTENPPEAQKVESSQFGVKKPTATPASFTYWLKGSAIERVWDRNENEWDYLIVFKLPINYCPVWMKVYAQNWYGGLGTPRVDFYYSGFINGVYTVKFLAGSRVISWYGSDPSRYYLTFPYP